MSNRDTYKYKFCVDGKIVHTGITNDLERREKEHQSKYGGEGKIIQVGNKATRKGSLEWESNQHAEGRLTGP